MCIRDRLGSLADEGNHLFPVNEALTDQELEVYLTKLVGSASKSLAAEYAQEFDTPGKIQHAVATDLFCLLYTSPSPRD